MEARRRLGRILSIVGSIWLALTVLAGMGLFGNSQFAEFFAGGLFLPLAVIFGGRVLRRMANRGQEAEADDVEERTPPRLQRQPGVADTPAEVVSESPPVRRPSERVVTNRELAEALGHVTGKETASDPGTSVERTNSNDLDEDSIGAGDGPETKRPLTSAEMVEEARRKYGSSG